MATNDAVCDVPLAEAAQRLGLSWGQAWRLVLVGRLSAQKVGGRWLCRRDDVERFARERKVEGWAARSER